MPRSRGLLDMTQLAAASEASLRTIVHFEANQRTAVPGVMTAIRSALEQAGVEFIRENGGGPGFRLAKHQRQR